MRAAGGAAAVTSAPGGTFLNWPMAAFVFLGVVVVYSGWRVATAPLVTHAALFLATTFAGVAGLFFLLQADFLAAVQLLLYAGAVMTVVIFAIMLSEMKDVEEHGDVGASRQKGHGGLLGGVRSPLLGFLPLVGSVLLFGVLLFAYVRGAPGLPATPVPAPADSTAFIAGALFNTYALPFEVASVLLLAAMIGAIVLTRAEGGRRR